MKKKIPADKKRSVFYSKNVLFPINDINILKQHRETFESEGIQALADNIAGSFLLEPIVVVYLRKKTHKNISTC